MGSKTLDQALTDAKPGEAVFLEDEFHAVCVIKKPNDLFLFCMVLDKVTGDDVEGVFTTTERLVTGLQDFLIDGSTGWEQEDTFFIRHPEVEAGKAVVVSRKGVEPTWLNPITGC